MLAVYDHKRESETVRITLVSDHGESECNWCNAELPSKAWESRIGVFCSVECAALSARCNPEMLRG